MRFFIFFLISFNVYSQSELLKVRTELDNYSQSKESRLEKILSENHISREFISKVLSSHPRKSWKVNLQNKLTQRLCRNLEVTKVKVHEAEDDFWGDDLYFYFIVRDENSVQTHVSRTYSDLHSGESAFFHPDDRLLFPYKDDCLISLDYGIIESESSDRDQMRRITAISQEIIEEALSSTQNLSGDLQLLALLIKKLTEIFSLLDGDDHLVQGQLRFPKNKEIIERRHRGTHLWSDWDYGLFFLIN